jgi:hypothetical protein
MPKYRVIYENEVEAEDPQTAAVLAFETMADASTYPPILGVTDLATGEENSIDLADHYGAGAQF